MGKGLTAIDRDIAVVDIGNAPGPSMASQCLIGRSNAVTAGDVVSPGHRRRSWRRPGCDGSACTAMLAGFAIAPIVDGAGIHDRRRDVLISEATRAAGRDIADRLVPGRPTRGAALVARPNEFTVAPLETCVDGRGPIRPARSRRMMLQLTADGSQSLDIADAVADDLPPGAPFYCTDGVCLARHPSGAIIAHCRRPARTPGRPAVSPI